jgi:hypothetical protein
MRRTAWRGSSERPKGTEVGRGERKKPHPPGQKSEGGGEGAPWGWVGPGQLGWGKAGKSTGQAERERKAGVQAWTY